MSIEINIPNSGNAPVYCKYDGQLQEQPAYLEFDPSKNDISLTADYSGEIGSGIPSAIWMHKIIRLNINPHTSRDAIIELANSKELEAELCNIRDIYEEQWNGSNYIGTYKGFDRDDYCSVEDKAQKIIDEHLSNYIEIEVWDAAEWLDPGFDLQKALDLGIEAYATDLGYSASVECVELNGDLESAIADILSNKVEYFIQNEECYTHEQIRSVAEMLNEYDSDKYGRYLDSYVEEYGSGLTMKG